MNLSMNTLMLAIKAVQRDIKRHEDLLQDGTLTEEDCDYYGQYVLDLTKALSELGGTYQAARREHPELPALDELMKRQEKTGGRARDLAS